MNKSIIAMAAGMGSRFGGLKQAAKFGPENKTMLDFALEDALAAGFTKAVFVIRRDIEKIFRECVSGKYENKTDVRYVFQDESGQPLPEGRTKPWGTGHAVLACIDEISEPFLAINADAQPRFSYHAPSPPNARSHLSLPLLPTHPTNKSLSPPLFQEKQYPTHKEHASLLRTTQD